jgi:amidase
MTTSVTAGHAVGPDDGELYYRTAVDLVRLLRAKEVSAREVVAAHLDRIEAVNPAVNAIVTLTADRAMHQAALADEAAARGEFLGPLHGIPVAHKDNHLTAGIRTTFGSRTRADFVPDQDDLVIERMRAAGVITLGKTNIPEFAAGGNTFNEVFGVTRNPYDLSVTVGGSSGGAAAALAAGMHPLADGNDFGGSLRLPAGFCNVVGLRPSAGRVPSYPDAEAFTGLSVSGPMARTVDDVALLLSVLAGPDRRSPISLEEQGAAFALVPEAGLVGRRVAFSVDLGGAVEVEAEVADLVRRAAAACEAAGAIVEEASPDFSGADECFRTLRAWRFEAALGAFLDEHAEAVRPNLYANMLASRGRPGGDPADSAVPPDARVPHRYRHPAAPGLAAAGVLRRHPASGKRRGYRPARLSRLDARGVSRDGDRAPGDRPAGWVQRRRYPGGRPVRWAAPGRTRTVGPGQGLRGRDTVRPGPPDRDLTMLDGRIGRPRSPCPEVVGPPRRVVGAVTSVAADNAWALGASSDQPVVR